MKIMVVGCGSMGRRHAANARELGEVAVVEIHSSRLKQITAALGVTGFSDLNDALAWGPDFVVAATPTNMHLAVASRAVDAGAHVLVEKPISHSLAGVEDFLAKARQKNLRIHVVCNMRFHPAVKSLRQGLTFVGRPFFARAHYGNYLPSMRPGADYRDLYCARASEGGGVLLDAIHEIDYLTWLFGSVEAVKCESTRLSDLDIDSEDYAGIVLRHYSGVRSEVHLDYLQRLKRRGCEVVGSKGTVIWLSEGKMPERCEVRVYDAVRDHWETILEDPRLDSGQMYFEMLESFIRGDGSSDLLDGEGACEALKVVLSAKQSAAEERTVLCPHMEKTK